VRSENRYHATGVYPVKYVVELVVEALETPDATEETTDCIQTRQLNSCQHAKYLPESSSRQ